jgi:hypothetical protein
MVFMLELAFSIKNKKSFVVIKLSLQGQLISNPNPINS